MTLKGSQKSGRQFVSIQAELVQFLKPLFKVVGERLFHQHLSRRSLRTSESFTRVCVAVEKLVFGIEVASSEVHHGGQKVNHGWRLCLEEIVEPLFLCSHVEH